MPMFYSSTLAWGLWAPGVWRKLENHRMSELEEAAEWSDPGLLCWRGNWGPQREVTWDYRWRQPALWALGCSHSRAYACLSPPPSLPFLSTHLGAYFLLFSSKVKEGKGYTAGYPRTLWRLGTIWGLGRPWEIRGPFLGSLHGLEAQRAGRFKIYISHCRLT